MSSWLQPNKVALEDYNIREYKLLLLIPQYERQMLTKFCFSWIFCPFKHFVQTYSENICFIKMHILEIVLIYNNMLFPHYPKSNTICKALSATTPKFLINLSNLSTYFYKISKNLPIAIFYLHRQQYST